MLKLMKPRQLCSNFQHFAMYPNFSIFLLLLVLAIILVCKGYSKIKMQDIHKNYWQIFKISMPSAVGI